MYDSIIQSGLDKTINETTLSNHPKTTGKVRDIYDLGEQLLLVSTDRLSAFDRNLCTIPFKGQVLNLISQFWFDKTQHLIKNHMIDLPYANAMRVKKLTVFPIEFVVRAYITGTTSTSLWTLYQGGLREVSGRRLPCKLKKNDKLVEPIITPTTKSNLGDKPIEVDDIISQGLMSSREWDEASTKALQVFDYATKLAKEKGLILVDTKFEFAKDNQGNILLADEALSPDSSRYWRAENYDELIAQGREPDNFDKEIIRLWYKENCSPYQDKQLPKAPDELRIRLAQVYINFYEKMTGNNFDFNLPVLDGTPQTYL